MSKILIVEDSEFIRTRVVEYFSGTPHIIVQAGDGYEALSELDINRDVGLIFADIHMPNMDGFTFCKLVKEKAEFKAIPFVFMTTEGSLDIRLKAKEMGVVAWLTKPFTKEQMFEVVNKLTQKK